MSSRARVRRLLPRRSFASAATLALLLFARPAHAQTQPEVATSPPTVDPGQGAEAQALFRRGLELGTEDRWADALSLFLRSRSLIERPSTIFNIGVALGRLGRFREAVATLDEYLALPEAATSDARPEAQRLRAEANAALAELSLALAPEDAAVEVDGAAREGSGTPRLVTLDPGRHILRARREGFEDGMLELSVLAAEHPSVSLTLAERVLAPPPPPPPLAPPSPSTSLVDDPVFWIVVVASTLAVGTAVGVGVGVATSESPPSNGGSTGIVLVVP